MAIADFRPVLSGIRLNTAGSLLTGDNAGFCAKLLGRTARGQPGGLESLVYVLPGQEQRAGGQGDRPSVVVNLLMQLRASFDQNNLFLRTGQMSRAQITARLHRTLTQYSGAARAQAAEIEQAVRTSLFQEEQFNRALRKLEG